MCVRIHKRPKNLLYIFHHEFVGLYYLMGLLNFNEILLLAKGCCGVQYARKLDNRSSATACQYL